MVIGRHNSYLLAFKTFITFLSLFSAYIYAFQAAFESLIDSHFLHTLDFIFEGFFLLAIGLNFLEE